MRVIVDTNVAIAAVVSRGLCEAILELCLEHHHLVLGEGILREIEAKLRNKLKIPPKVISEYLTILGRNSLIVAPEAVDRGICRDPHDLKILGLVVPGNADAIVTGDQDLLVIKQYKSARILTPRAFWELNRKRV